MLSTFTDYQIIVKNLSKTLDRTAGQSDAKKEIAYFRDHIGQVTSIDDFLGNNRLYTFAMKAYGLDDMIYAKGFMKKVLLGEADASGRVLVDRLQDTRYQDFARAFNFRSFGTDPSQKPTSDDPQIQAMIEFVAAAAQTPEQKKADYDTETEQQVQYLWDVASDIKTTKDIASDYKINAAVRTVLGMPSASPDDDVATKAEQIDGQIDPAIFQNAGDLSGFVTRYLSARQEGRKAIVDLYYRPAGSYGDSETEIDKLAQYFQAKASTLHSADDVVADPALAEIVRDALGLPDDTAAKSSTAQATLIASKLDVTSLHDPRTLSQFIDRFKASRNEAREATVDAYVRQTLETDAGTENEGVRLALYFQRKASSITSAYSILADPALAEVARTALGLPSEAARSSIEGQAKLIEQKLDLASFKDPTKLDQFIRRFTILWDAQTGAASAPELSLFDSSASGLDSDVLLKLQSIRLGGH